MARAQTRSRTANVVNYCRDASLREFLWCFRILGIFGGLFGVCGILSQKKQGDGVKHDNARTFVGDLPFEISDQILMYAAEKDEILKWAKEHGCPCGEATLHAANFSGFEDLWAWLNKTYTFPWSYFHKLPTSSNYLNNQNGKQRRGRVFAQRSVAYPVVSLALLAER